MIRNLLLLCLTVSFCFLIAEVTFRWLDPFPYYHPDQINHAYHGNLSTYDSLLGWRGIPHSEADIVTHNNRFRVRHNRAGHRDISHDQATERRPGIVFLGDSFTWGYEVGWEQMFVNILRDRLPDYTLYNLAHNGYGTDQSLLTFRYWQAQIDLRWVILVFTENDVGDNNARRRYFKSKPRFELLYGHLLLTGVPVAREDEWDDPQRTVGEAEAAAEASPWLALAFRSHLIHDMNYRLSALSDPDPQPPSADPPPLQLTSALLRELEREVQGRGAELLVVLVPSKAEIDELTADQPYQHAIASLCREHGIAYLDLAPFFRDTWFRTYYRLDMHWNPRGHRVAADAIAEFILARPPLPSVDFPAAVR